MKHLLATVILALIASGANAITYHVDRALVDELGQIGTVKGFIETNGALGVLSETDILNWSLTLQADNINGGNEDTISLFDDQGGIAGDTILRGNAVIAEGSHLWYDFSVDSGTRGDYFFLAGNSGNFWCLETTLCVGDSPTLVEQIGRNDQGGRAALYVQYEVTDKIAFATAVIPVPAAVWLFGSGLLGLIGMARIRR